jgi:hypothetical protein
VSRSAPESAGTARWAPRPGFAGQRRNSVWKRACGRQGVRQEGPRRKRKTPGLPSGDVAIHIPFPWRPQVPLCLCRFRRRVFSSRMQSLLTTHPQPPARLLSDKVVQAIRHRPFRDELCSDIPPQDWGRNAGGPAGTIGGFYATETYQQTRLRHASVLEAGEGPFHDSVLMRTSINFGFPS